MAKLTKNKSTQTHLLQTQEHELNVLPDLARKVTQSIDNPEEITIKLSAQVILENFLNKHFCFRKNIVTSRIEFKPINASEYDLLNEYNLNSIYRMMKLNRINTNISELRAIVNSDFVKKFDPFVSYFENLPIWDEKTDYIDELAETVTTTNNNLWKICLRKWLVGMVGCAIDENIISHQVLLLVGGQGVGKSSWVLGLIPDKLKAYRFSGTLNLHSKDSLSMLSENILINCDEFESFNKVSVAQFKEIVTKSVIKVRKAYGYNSENYVRRASFTGTANTSDILHDESGSRRFMIFTAKTINYKHNVNIDNVMAQAYALYKSGFEYWVSGDEINELSMNNDYYSNTTLEEELLLAYFVAVSKDEATSYLSTTDIASNLSEYRKINITNAFKQNLGKALAKHKFVRVKKNGRWVYALKNKPFQISTSFSLTGVQEN
jgi:predicted P-loop ATPase